MTGDPCVPRLTGEKTHCSAFANSVGQGQEVWTWERSSGDLRWRCDKCCSRRSVVLLTNLRRHQNFHQRMIAGKLAAVAGQGIALPKQNAHVATCMVDSEDLQSSWIV